MLKHPGTSHRRALWAVVLCVATCGLATSTASGQESAGGPAPRYSLDDCLKLGMAHQPALAAARASLGAAEAGLDGVNGLPRIAALLSRDLPVRRQQACLGVTIAAAGLEQAQWETRYAVTRNYFSVLYARQQDEVLESVVGKLQRAHERAQKLVGTGAADIKLTRIDVDLLALNLEFVRAKKVETEVGAEKAKAALREAIGLGCNVPFDVAKGSLPAPVANLDRDEMIKMALSRRGEIVEAESAAQVTALEVRAQSRVILRPKVNTFAAAADVHARPIPQGVANTEYRPGAIGLEVPGMLVGRRGDRVARAQEYQNRAAAVVDKTHNLIALEVEAAYLKWKEASEKIRRLEKTPNLARKIAEDVVKRFDGGNASGEELIRARTLEDQAQAQLNEALYMHALALAALERVTAGGYRPTYAAPK